MHTSAKYQNSRVQVGVLERAAGSVCDAGAARAVRVIRVAIVGALVCAGAVSTMPVHAQSQSQTQPQSPSPVTEQFVLRADGSITPVAGAAQTRPVGQISLGDQKTSSPTTSSNSQALAREVAPIAPAKNMTATPASSASGKTAGSWTSIVASENTPAAKAVAAARQALNSKQPGQLASLVPQARGDVLATYPEYWLLRTQLGQYRTPGVRQSLEQFLEQNNGAYLADRLRGEWVLTAARSGDFVTVRALGPVLNPTNQVLCSQLEARHMGGQRATAAEAIKIFVPFGTCWKLFDQLVADRVLTPDELLTYLHDAIENNKLPDARRFAAYLFDANDLIAYDAMIKAPAAWLATQTASGSAMRNQIVAIGLARQARTDLAAAEASLKRQWQDKLPKSNTQWVYGQLGLIASMNLDPRAYDWYRQSGSARLSDNNEAWRVRMSLRQPKIDWKWVMQSIDTMDATQRADPAWVYWKARGLAATGKKSEAEKAYASIAGDFSFYGQLAAEELGRTIVAPKRPDPVTEQELAQARANPGLQRAVTLFKRGWRPEAVPEWNFTLRGMTDRQLLAASELARRESIYDRVVVTSGRTKNEVDFNQRFVAPFEGRVSAQARAVNVDPAWVYGLIRQESLFIMDARSHVGASGLMQLMPATARWMAKKIGMTDFTPSSVNDFDTNTRLGTSYLSMVQADLGGSEVLASAGYNAGPGRPMLWRSKLNGPVEGAIFAETIPFNETRDYVKKVMSNATYYAAVFSGQPQSLKKRLGQIEPQPYGRSPLP
ncbi:transglycosylase SLT domain-containing protein [Zwartia sp.]|uniref:lytic transglycosylase domain-containing protein n=1 Tax=Zwartia sp. TaxID=2978004 RepID=UPI003917F129